MAATWGGLFNVVALAVLVQVAAAATYTVGGSEGGWDLSTDLLTWASAQTFVPGDSLSKFAMLSAQLSFLFGRGNLFYIMFIGAELGSLSVGTSWSSVAALIPVKCCLQASHTLHPTMWWR